MAAILDRLVKQLRDKGHSTEAANAIAVAALQRSGNLKQGSTEPTAKGLRRGAMTPAERAKDRAAKVSGRKTTEYTYNAKTNRATLKVAPRGSRKR
jgi:hypothetical protein